MKLKNIFLILVIFQLIPICYAYRPSLEPATFDWFSAFRDKIGFLEADNIWTGNNTFNNVTFVTLATYNITDSLCLDNNCISDWDEVNQSGSSTTTYIIQEISSTIYTGSDAINGSDGNSNRAINDTGVIVVKDNYILIPNTDYINNTVNTTFLAPLWDDQNLVFYENSENSTLTTTVYDGSDLSGSSGDTSRTLSVVTDPEIIAIDNYIGISGVDYSYSNYIVTFNVPIWDDQKISMII